jgi:lantibiotic biosynthesis protein
LRLAKALMNTRVMDSRWTAVLSGRTRSEALDAVDAVTRDLVSRLNSPWPANLMTGHLGLALFFHERWRHEGDAHLEPMTQCLVRATNLFARRGAPPGLHSGFAGLGWVAQHLAGDHSDLDVEELCAEVDERVEAALDGAGPHACELREGLPGFGLYALKRLPHPAGRRLLARVIDRLEETAEPSGQDALTWALPPSFWTLHGAQATFPRGLYTVGVAHGVPAALAVLAAAHRLGLERERTQRLLRGGFAWLDGLAPEHGHPAFPHYLHGGERFGDERFSWCVGNPGITAVLWWAAQAWGEARWEARALDWAEHVAREALERPRPTSANLCCGTAGTAHLFLRLFHATHRPLFAEASVRWLEHTLALRQPGQGSGGFGADPHPTHPVTNLQFGSAGIALTLLAAASELSPTWDSPFLFSLPSPPPASP